MTPALWKSAALASVAAALLAECATVSAPSSGMHLLPDGGVDHRCIIDVDHIIGDCEAACRGMQERGSGCEPDCVGEPDGGCRMRYPWPPTARCTRPIYGWFQSLRRNAWCASDKDCAYFRDQSCDEIDAYSGEKCYPPEVRCPWSEDVACVNRLCVTRGDPHPVETWDRFMEEMKKADRARQTASEWKGRPIPQ
jgi:hypothetical protein